MQEVDKIWMDGKLVSWGKANIHILTHTLHYGFGVFEGIRCYKTEEGPAIFRLNEHVNRFFNSAHILKIKLPFSKEKISDAIKDTIKANKLDECYIRPLAYLGYGAMGLNPLNSPVNVAIAVWPWGVYLGEDALTNGLRAKISSFTRHHSNISMTKAKVVGNYVNSSLATMEAKEMGYDEAILLDPRGYVAEGSGENIFVVKNNILRTPLPDSILPGITRASIMELANDLDYDVCEGNITRDELYIADEVFLTGTAAEITPVREVDGRVIGEGKPGLVTKKLQIEFSNIVHGKNEKYSRWLECL